MSAHEEVTGEVEADATEGNEENSVRFSLGLVGERVRASLETLHAQFSAPTEMMERLIKSYLVKETTRLSTHETKYQHESPFSGAARASRFLTVAPLTTLEYSPDTQSEIFIGKVQDRYSDMSFFASQY